MNEMKLSPGARYALEKLAAAGHEAYCVGGCVRDMLMDRVPHDYDAATNALPETVVSVFGKENTYLTGMKHGTVTVVYNGENVEITTYRLDGDYSDHRRPDEVRFSDSIYEDLSRRDFTINAIAVDINGSITDPFGGREDIGRRLIRCVGDAGERFEEDALRIMRALRFASVLGFGIDPDTSAAIHKKHELLRYVAYERITAELRKFLCGTPGDLMTEYSDVFSFIIPEFKPCVGFDQKSIYHRYTVYDHIANAVKNSVPDEIVRTALFFHDIEKPAVCTEDNDGHRHFRGHEALSAATAEKIMQRMHFDKKTTRLVKELIEWHHLRPENDGYLVRKVVSKIGFEQFFRLTEVLHGDNTAKNDLALPRVENAAVMADIARRLMAEGACCSLSALAVNGSDLAKTGFSGAQIGQMLEMLLDSVMSGKCSNDKDELLAYAKRTVLMTGELK